MPIEVQQPRDAISFADIVVRIAELLVASVPVDPSRVWVASMPDEQLPEYLADPGFLIRVFPPDPAPMSGGGRLAYITNRRVEVYPVTMNLADAGGKSNQATLAHIRAEEAVCAALTLDPSINKYVKWVPGGADIGRRVKTNKGLLASSLPFVVTYIPPLPVLRDSG